MHGGRGGHSEPGGRQVDARAAHREGLDEDLHGGPTKAWPPRALSPETTSTSEPHRLAVTFGQTESGFKKGIVPPSPTSSWNGMNSTGEFQTTSIETCA
jgi:hypothetical protein